MLASGAAYGTLDDYSSGTYTLLRSRRIGRTNMRTHQTGITRRDFIRNAAVASAAVPIIVPCTALGDETKTAAGERLTLGFIGVGTQNRGHVGYFLGQKDVQILAVCDVDTTRRESAKNIVEKRYGEQQKN